MIDLTRWYHAPEKPIAAKGAVIKTYYGSSAPALKIRAPKPTLDRLEALYSLQRRPAPIIGDP